MKNLIKTLPFLVLMLLLGIAAQAQSQGNTQSQPTVVDPDVGNPPPEWEPPTTLSDQEAVKLNVFSLYPNPSRGKVTLKYIAQSEQGDLLVYNLIGNLMRRYTLPKRSGIQEMDFDLSALPKGYYIVKLGERSLRLSIQ